MKTLVSVLALSGALLLTGIELAPVSAQTVEQYLGKCPAGVEMDISGAHITRYSWGVMIAGDEGPARSYTWEELAKFSAPESASVGAGLPADIEKEINGPRATHYDWGVVIAGDEGPARSYTREELDNLRSARSGSVGLTSQEREDLDRLLDPEWKFKCN